jgi:hypothetical protein
MFENLKSKMSEGLSGFRDEYAGAKAKLEAARRRREELISAPLTRDEVIELLCRHVEGRAAEYPGVLQDSITAVIREAPQDPAAIAQAIRGGVLCPAGLGAYETRGVLLQGVERAVFFCFGPQMKTAITEAVQQMTWPGCDGADAKTRAKELAQVEREVAQLEAQVGRLEEERQRIINSL